MTVRTYSLSKLLKNSTDEIAIKYVKEGRYKVTCNALFISVVYQHFKQVLRHRRWINHIFLYIAHALTYEDREILYDRILRHDLSKFSTIESIGYAIKFHRKNAAKKEKEKRCWEKALKHHYELNDHHPQHYEDGNMEQHALIESIIDMLACRIERDVTQHDFSVNSLFDIPEMYLERYSIQDRKKVCEHLLHWKSVLLHDI